MTDLSKKRGRSWHVAAVITQGDDGKYDVKNFVHFFSSGHGPRRPYPEFQVVFNVKTQEGKNVRFWSQNKQIIP